MCEGISDIGQTCVIAWQLNEQRSIPGLQQAPGGSRQAVWVVKQEWATPGGLSGGSAKPQAAQHRILNALWCCAVIFLDSSKISKQNLNSISV